LTEIAPQWARTNPLAESAASPFQAEPAHEEKLVLLNELQRIVQESKRALVDPDSKKC
jgi:hypothetical protein